MLARLILAFSLTPLVLSSPFSRPSRDVSSQRTRAPDIWPPIQLDGLKLPPDASIHAQAVKKIFTESYEGYRKYAFGHDDVKPMSKGAHDSRNGWGSTVADAMGTMLIMGLDDYFTEALNFTAHVNFNVSKISYSSVSVFETTIRYLGGLLSAYQLSGEKHPILLEKAKQVGDKLAFAWRGNNSLPSPSIRFEGNQGGGTWSTNIAEAGSLSLEFASLTAHTGNDTYQRLGVGAALAIAKNPGALPGLPAQAVGVSDGKTSGSYVTWGAASDSYLEYLIKYPRLISGADPIWINQWTLAVDSSIKHLLKKSVPGNWSFLADWNGGSVEYTSSHLACFHGGNWIMGGRLIKNETIIRYGLDLVDACIHTYQTTATGIGPETWMFASADGGQLQGYRRPTEAQGQYLAEHGFYVTNPTYIMRPEVLESNFYAWRATGDIKYYNNAIKAVKAFNEHLSLPNGEGFAGISDVTRVNSTKNDDTESFWFAEVLKYLYLTFDDPAHISLDEWVFNTEAHPLRPQVFVGGETAATSIVPNPSSTGVSAEPTLHPWPPHRPPPPPPHHGDRPPPPPEDDEGLSSRPPPLGGWPEPDDQDFVHIQRLRTGRKYFNALKQALYQSLFLVFH